MTNGFLAAAKNSGGSSVASISLSRRRERERGHHPLLLALQGSPTPAKHLMPLAPLLPTTTTDLSLTVNLSLGILMS